MPPHSIFEPSGSLGSMSLNSPSLPPHPSSPSSSSPSSSPDSSNLSSAASSAPSSPSSSPGSSPPSSQPSTPPSEVTSHTFSLHRPLLAQDVKKIRNQKRLSLMVPPSPTQTGFSVAPSPSFPPTTPSKLSSRRPFTPVPLSAASIAKSQRLLDHALPSTPHLPMSANSNRSISAYYAETTNFENQDPSPYVLEPVCILPNLYLGAEHNAVDSEALGRLDITYILNVASEIQDPNTTTPARQSHIHYKRMPWTHNQRNLATEFPTAFLFIDEARQSGRNVLVHCQLGVSRSASLVIAYVMHCLHKSLNEAYEYVKQRSAVISPNMSLMYQLVEFEKILTAANGGPRTPMDIARQQLSRPRQPSTPLPSTPLTSSFELSPMSAVNSNKRGHSKSVGQQCLPTTSKRNSAAFQLGLRSPLSLSATNSNSSLMLDVVPTSTASRPSSYYSSPLSISVGPPVAETPLSSKFPDDIFGPPKRSSSSIRSSSYNNGSTSNNRNSGYYPSVESNGAGYSNSKRNNENDYENYYNQCYNNINNDHDNDLIVKSEPRPSNNSNSNNSNKPTLPAPQTRNRSSAIFIVSEPSPSEQQPFTLPVGPILPTKSALRPVSKSITIVPAAASNPAVSLHTLSHAIKWPVALTSCRNPSTLSLNTRSDCLNNTGVSKSEKEEEDQDSIFSPRPYSPVPMLEARSLRDFCHALQMEG